MKNTLSSWIDRHGTASIGPSVFIFTARVWFTAYMQDSSPCREDLLAVDSLPDQSGYVAWQAAIFHCVICCLAANYRHIRGLCCVDSSHFSSFSLPHSYFLFPLLTPSIISSPHRHIVKPLTLLYIISITGSSLNNLWWSEFAYSCSVFVSWGPKLLTSLNLTILSNSSFLDLAFRLFSSFWLITQTHYGMCVPLNVSPTLDVFIVVHGCVL